MKRGKPGDVPGTYRLAVVERDEAGEFTHPFVGEVPIAWPTQNLARRTLAAARTGSWLWAIDITLAQYLALRQIETWGERTLARMDRLGGR